MSIIKHRGFFYSKQSLLAYIFLLTVLLGNTQARLIINGAAIVLNKGAALVIDNPDNSAITRINTGYISTEDSSNKIFWTIGAGNSINYTVPFGNTTHYFPLKFQPASGSNNGRFIFGSYPSKTWKNSDDLPPGVSNLNAGTGDSSNKIVDRFWLIGSRGYSNKPTLNNLSFTYNDNELQAPNEIAEANLIAERWNAVLQRWNDYLPASSVNTAINTVTVASLPATQLNDWWMLIDQSNGLLQSTHLIFNALVTGTAVLSTWTTDFEENLDHFEVFRSTDGIQFESIGSAPAKNAGAIRNSYLLLDPTPYQGISFYKLKIFDKSGGFKWSETIAVNIGTKGGTNIFPNPATDYFIITTNVTVINQKPMASLYDAKGSRVLQVQLVSMTQRVDVSRLAKGAYLLRITYNKNNETIRLIKK